MCQPGLVLTRGHSSPGQTENDRFGWRWEEAAVWGVIASFVPLANPVYHPGVGGVTPEGFPPARARREGEEPDPSRAILQTLLVLTPAKHI